MLNGTESKVEQTWQWMQLCFMSQNHAGLTPILCTVNDIFQLLKLGIVPFCFPCAQNAGTVSVEEGRPYESGVQLTSDGMRGLLLHSTWRNLSVNSHCMLLWINVASFCVSLLTREGERLRGIYSRTVQLEEYCVFQLRHIWKLMRSNMQLTDEELSYLVMMCMRRKLQVCVSRSLWSVYKTSLC